MTDFTPSNQLFEVWLKDRKKRKKAAQILDKAADLLDKAADLLDKEGWCRNQFKDATGRRCLVGAINDAAELIEASTACANIAKRSVQNAIAINPYHPPNSSIMYWNDRQNDKRKVIRLLHRVAKDLRSDAPAS